MRRPLTAFALALVLTGCGSAGSSSSSGDACSSAYDAAKVVATTDVDGDGKADQVGLTGRTGRCAHRLFVRQGKRIASVSGRSATAAYAVRLPGRSGALVVTESGGAEPVTRVYAADEGVSRLVELQDDGRPVVPTGPRDAQHPFSVSCGDAAVVVTRAVAHEPIGVVPAWDVRVTTYTVDGTDVSATTRETADNVLPDQLATRYPALVRHSLFAACRV